MNLQVKLFLYGVSLSPLALMAILYAAKRHDREFLVRTEKTLAPIRWCLWIPGAIIILAGLVFDRRMLLFGGISLTSASIGLGAVVSWIRQRCGLTEAPNKDGYWPSNQD